MPSSTVQSIGDRITYAWHEGALTIIIDQAIPRSQRLMLEGWFLAWLGVGGATAMEMAGATGSDRTFFLVFMTFWVFFAFRVLKVIKVQVVQQVHKVPLLHRGHKVLKVIKETRVDEVQQVL